MVRTTHTRNLGSVSGARRITRPWFRRLYPEEFLALILIVVTVTINIAIHQTLDARILTSTVSSYGILFQGHLREFWRTLLGCFAVYAIWQITRLVRGRPLHVFAFRRIGVLLPATRALLVYILCGTAYSNLESVIHRLSPIDRDAWLIAVDRALFFGHDPLKLMEPLVTHIWVRFFVQVYMSLFIVVWVPMLVFLYQGKLRAFRDTIVSLLLALWIGYPFYLLVPAIGPLFTQRYEFTRPTVDIDSMLWYGTDYLSRATFPSMHTGISVTILLLIWRHKLSQPLRMLFTIWIAGIVFSTLYLRQHYVIDVIAGLALALLASRIGPWINARYADLSELESDDTRSFAEQAVQPQPATAPSPPQG